MKFRFDMNVNIGKKFECEAEDVTVAKKMFGEALDRDEVTLTYETQSTSVSVIDYDIPFCPVPSAEVF